CIDKTSAVELTTRTQVQGTGVPSPSLQNRSISSPGALGGRDRFVSTQLPAQAWRHLDMSRNESIGVGRRVFPRSIVAGALAPAAMIAALSPARAQNAAPTQFTEMTVEQL